MSGQESQNEGLVLPLINGGGSSHPCLADPVIAAIPAYLMERTSDYEITAIRYNGTRKWFTVWDTHGKPFQVRRSDLNVDQDKIEEAKQQTGKRCKLTGARCDVDVGSSKTDLALFTGLGLELRHDDLPSAKYQVSKEFCAVNSVANLVDLPRVLYDHITKQGRLLELEKVRNIINGWKCTPCQLL